MRIRIDYRTAYDYAEAAAGVIQLLRVQPRTSEEQHVANWRVDVDADGALRPSTDVFGNLTHMFYAESPIRGLTLHVAGEIETHEGHGLVRGTFEPLPPLFYLRPTALTAPDPALRDFARSLSGSAALDRLHALLEGVNGRVAFDTDATHSATDAATAFGLGAGVCQDHAQVFVTAARLLGIPARYVSGHFVRSDGADAQTAAHAWAEAYVEDLGWVGFDPANGISTTESHVRVAVGLDYLDAAPVRGARRGGGLEALNVSVSAVDMRAAKRQTQRQAQ